MSKKLNKIVDRKQIPFKYRARRPKIVQWLARIFLRSFRWKVEGVIQPVKGSENLIIIAGPHTSNRDGVFGYCLGEMGGWAIALDWLGRENFDYSQCWVSVFSFGSVIAIQLLMR